MSRHPNRFDRRLFLRGSSGLLLLPMLEAFAPRIARGQTVAAPKRLIIMAHPGGRVVGNGRTENGVLQDLWNPATQTGPLPATMSPLLAPLAAIRDELVTLDGIDNVLRHTSTDPDGHSPGALTMLTAKKPTGQAAGGATFDYQMGLRLRPNSSMRASVVVPGHSADATWRLNNTALFFGANGSAPTIISPNPAEAITELFGAPMPTMPAPAPTLRERLVKQRGSVLDGVRGQLGALRSRVNAADKARLDAHAEYVRALETRAGGGGGGVVAQSCQRPDASSVPSIRGPGGAAYVNGEQAAVMTPLIIENVAQAIACDAVRSLALFFYNGDGPVFPTEFPSNDPFATANWHATVHNTPRLSDGSVDDLKKSFLYYAKSFTALVQRLAALTDVDGTRVLDNTLVLWVSDMAYGAAHAYFNVPVVMAGMRSAFPKGQGRHVVAPRHTMGDLFAQIARMFGGSDQTWGDTGVLGDHNTGDLVADAGFPGHISRGTPLHAGPLDL